MIAYSNSSISSKNMSIFTSNDIVHNHYIEEAKKRMQERSRNSEPSLMSSGRSKSTANEHPRNSRNDYCVTKFLKEVNSRAKVPSNKTTNRNKPAEQISVPNKQERQIPTGHRFLIQKTSIVQKKTKTPRSCLRWKPTGKIFKTDGLRWVPTGKIFTSSTTKVDSEPLNGSNADISNQYECEQTLDVSVDISETRASRNFHLMYKNMTSDHNSLELGTHDNSNELSKFKAGSRRCSSSRQDSYITINVRITIPPSHNNAEENNDKKRRSNPSMNFPSTSAPSTHTNVHAEENDNDQAKEGEQLQDDEFTNPLCAPVQEAESSSHNIEQVHGNPSRPVQTRRQLATDPEMCIYALTVSTAKPKNIKEEKENQEKDKTGKKREACAKCGHPVNGLYYQGCALLREKLKEDLVSYLKYFHDTSEPSDDSTNVVNAPREPFVVKQDHGVNPPHIDKCCCECGNALDGIFCQQCICKSCGKAKDHFEIVINSKDDISSSDDDSLYNENIEYVEASPYDSELVSLEVAENVIPKEEEIEDDNLCEKLLNVHLLIANIEALKDNHTLSSKFLTKSSSTSSKSFLEETNTFHNSLPEFENFYFYLEEISSGNTTTHSDISLPDYKAFYFDDDHVKEISSGSPTTQSDISLSEYDSFTFDLSNDQCSPTDMSDFTHEEFADELAHIISPPEYDCFYFRDLPDPGELISIFNSGIRENLSTTHVNLPVEDDYSPLLTYVVWVFLAYLTYPVIPPYLHPFRNKDTIFDPGITINYFYSFKPGLSHRCGAFKKFNTHRSHLNEWPMIINGKEHPYLGCSSVPFLSPLINSSMGGIGSSIGTLNKRFLSSIPGNLKTLAKGFNSPSVKFLSFILGIQYPNLID
nr:actin-binding, cofilin/tropomyosin type [Tanacetum cinerariifolium]